MKLRDHYDWVVLGDHPGALLSAGLAARLGLSVLVLPVFPGRALSVAKDGRFVDPEPNYLLGLGKVARSRGLLGECLQRLGVLPAELEQILDGKPLSEIMTPRLRLDFCVDDENLEKVLQRELGKSPTLQSAFLLALKRVEADYLAFWLQLPERLTLSPGKKGSVATSRRIQDVRRKAAKVNSGQAFERWLNPAQSASRLANDLDLPGVVEMMEGFWFGHNGSALEDPPSRSFCIC